MAKKRRTKRTRRRICAEDIKQFKLISDPQISATGNQIVFVVKQVGNKNNYLTQLWLVETVGGEPRQFTSGKKDHSPGWSPTGRQIAFVSEREEEHPQIYLIDVDGGEASQLTSFPEGSLGQFRWSPDGRQLAVVFREQHPDWTKAAEKNRKETGLSLPPRVAESAWYRLDGDGYFLEQRYKLYLVDAESGEMRVIYDRDTIGFMDFDFSPDSRELIVSTNRDKQALPRFWRDELWRINVKTGKSKRVAGLPEGPKSRVRWSADGRFIAYAGREGVDESYSVENLELFLYDLQAGKLKSLTEQEDYCLLAVAITDTSEAEFAPWFEFSSDGKRILCRIGVEGEMRIASVPVAGGRLEFCASDQPDCAPGNVSSGDGRLALTVGGSTTLPEIAVARCRRHDLEVRQLSDLNGPLLQQLELSTPKSHWIKAADGHRSQAWVMKPPGARAGKEYPAVLQIHGGPHAQYGLGFFHEFQVLAAAGYVVVFSNPRGSKGYGQEHCAAIQGNWGSTDWTDIQAVTRFMQKHPSINPS
ncbi:MAG: prolyl oligopeptidase family serine peptidase, partial [Pirellulaceae bacterium]